MQNRMGAQSVDLIYLDPPFNSKKNYNLMYKSMTGMPVSEQVEAFCDTWEMDAEKQEIAKNMPSLMREHDVNSYYCDFWDLWVSALAHTQPHLLAYLIYMVQRLLWMKTILRPAGSIYLHCDPTASHYIKVMMDGIFDHNNFRNEIVWKRTGTHSDSKTWSRVSDTILFYTAGKVFTWNIPRDPHSQTYLASKYRFNDSDGRCFRLDNMTSPNSRPNMMYDWKGFPFPEKGWRYSQDTMQRLDSEGRIWYPTLKDGALDVSRRPQLKRYLDESEGGGVMGNVWTDISPLNSQADERLGYPTQKPIALLDRIILASTNRGDVIFDPFCGCGTTIYSAIKNDRKWIGCDIAILSIKLIRELLTGDRWRLVEGTHYRVSGIPVSVEQAALLARDEPHQFQKWFVERIGGFPHNKKGGDRGIDGWMWFEMKEGRKSMVLSVKGGNIHPTDVRDLRGVLERERNAVMAGFLCLNEPTRQMKQEAAAAGQWEYSGNSYDRLQLLSVKDVLEKKRLFNTPTKLGTRAATGQSSLTL